MFGGGGGMNPRKMEQMMEQMGIDMEELDAQEVIIRTADTELVFDAPDVTKMDARGNETYTVVGSPEVREGESDAEDDADADADADDEDEGIPEEDVELVAQRAGVGKSEALEALEGADGDLAAAIDTLE
jgi:nascent polypeptide-associated complex subunit alpha